MSTAVWSHETHPFVSCFHIYGVIDALCRMSIALRSFYSMKSCVPTVNLSLLEVGTLGMSGNDGLIGKSRLVTQGPVMETRCRQPPGSSRLGRRRPLRSLTIVSAVESF